MSLMALFVILFCLHICISRMSKFISCLLNLICNLVIYSNVNNRLLIVSKIRLDLLSSLVLTFCREPLRLNIVDAIRISSICHYINLIWSIVSIGLTTCLFFIYFLFNWNCLSIVVYLLSTLIELSCEPFYLLLNVTKHESMNDWIELIVCLSTFAIQMIFVKINRTFSLIDFGLIQLFGSCLRLLIYNLILLRNSRENRIRLFRLQSWKDLSLKLTCPFVDHRYFNQIFESFRMIISNQLLADLDFYLIIFFGFVSIEQQILFYLFYLFQNLLSSSVFVPIQQLALDYFTNQRFSLISSSENLEVKQTTIKLNSLTLLNHLIRLSMIFFVLSFAIVVNVSMNIYLLLSLLRVTLKQVNHFTELFVRCFLPINLLNLYENSLFVLSLINLMNSYISMKYFYLFGLIFMNLLGCSIEMLVNQYFIQKYFYRNRSTKINFFFYILILLISILIVKLNQNLIVNLFGQVCFSFSFVLIVVCLIIVEEKEVIHYLRCVYRLNRTLLIKKER